MFSFPARVWKWPAVFFSYGPVKSCSPVGGNPDRLLERRSGITVEGVSGIGACRSIPVSETAGCSARRGEEGLQMREDEHSGEIRSSFGNIVINVYGKKEDRRPEGIDSSIRWGSGSHEPLHSPEELKKHIKKQAEQLRAKGCKEPFLYLRGDRKALLHGFPRSYTGCRRMQCEEGSFFRTSCCSSSRHS